MSIRLNFLVFAFIVILGAGAAWVFRPSTMGRQSDGSYIVSSGQRVPADEIAISGRLADLALHPRFRIAAVMQKNSIVLIDENGVLPNALPAKLGSDAGFHGLKWTPNGNELIASTAKGYLQVFNFQGGKLLASRRIELKLDSKDTNPVPGGFDISQDGKWLVVACINRNAVVRVDLNAGIRADEFPVQTMPYEARFSEDEREIVVSNWGGYRPKPGQKTMKSDQLDVVVDRVNAAKAGCVSIVEIKTKRERVVPVGLHPSGILVQGRLAYIANALSDTISEIDISRARVIRTFRLTWKGRKVIGSMPNAIASYADKLYVCNGGDNALCEIDLRTGRVNGWRQTGYFPIAVAVLRGGTRALVLNSKGSGSVANTDLGKQGNAHDFLGTVSVVNLEKEIAGETALVAQNNAWLQGPTGVRPKLKVYNGAIKHVLYIIKENRTYDEIFGDLPQGNGDPNLCSLGEIVMPNHRKIAQQFTLFDNGYVSGTNSADGHNWTTQGFANDYLEKFYVGYSRTYPDDGRDAMAISNSGTIWDAALKAGKSIRIYGEFMNADKNHWEPRAPKDWFEVWEMRKKGKYTLTPIAVGDTASVQKYGHPNYHYWPLWQSDQQRADIFIEEYSRFSKANKVPDLMVMSLPCDHGEGLNPDWPTPRAMMADNDLALGRIVEAVSKSPQWKETCIFVIEDDAQSGPDHVDGHRTAYMAISPYTKKRFVDSNLYTTVSMLKSIEMMLGLGPMNKFDLLAKPIDSCFSDKLDMQGYRHVLNNVPLDPPNPGRNRKPSEEEAFWIQKTKELDWSHIDAPDPYWLNRINWFSIHKGKVPYPSRPGDAPGSIDADD